MNKFSLREIDRIIEMAWEDRTPFEAIFNQFNINEKELISLMRNNLKRNSFKLWRERVSGRKTKHSVCLLYTSPSPRDQRGSRMPSSA